MSRRSDRARERSRKAVQEHTPPLPPVDEISFEGESMESLQAKVNRDVYAETAQASQLDPLGMLPEDPRRT
jgi:hypothetical protein